MNQYWYTVSPARSICLVGTLCMWANASSAEGPHAEVDGNAYMKGATVLRATFPSQGEVWRVSLSWRHDGETFFPANVGLPRPWNLFRSVAYEEEHTTILVPVVAFFTVSDPMMFFDQPGTYWFRWEISFRDKDKARTVPDQLDKDIEPVTLEQAITVGPARRVDVDFLTRLGDPDLVRAMFGDDIFERLTGNTREQFESPEVRAVKVIAELLKATRADEPGDVVGPRGGLENALKWAETLFGLAKEFPDSSYAPYAAYYAGCCYVGALGQENKQKHKEIVSPAGKESAYYGKAKEALSFAVARADAYLKPRALYHQAFLYGCAAEFDRVDESLDEALELGGRQGTIEKIVDKLRGDMRATREKQAAKQQDDD